MEYKTSTFVVYARCRCHWLPYFSNSSKMCAASSTLTNKHTTPHYIHLYSLSLYQLLCLYLCACFTVSTVRVCMNNRQTISVCDFVYMCARVCYSWFLSGLRGQKNQHWHLDIENICDCRSSGRAYARGRARERKSFRILYKNYT